jgi:hypothetical protein
VAYLSSILSTAIDKDLPTMKKTHKGWRLAIFAAVFMLAANFTITCPIPFECDTAVGVAAARAAI